MSSLKDQLATAKNQLQGDSDASDGTKNTNPADAQDTTAANAEAANAEDSKEENAGQATETELVELKPYKPTKGDVLLNEGMSCLILPTGTKVKPHKHGYIEAPSKEALKELKYFFGTGHATLVE